MKRLLPLWLSAGSAALAWLAWPERGFAPLLFFCWIPLLALEDRYLKAGKKARHLFGWVYLSFVVWNLLTTWWIYNSTVVGVVIAVFCNAFFMALVFMLFHFTRRRMEDIYAYPALIAYWISFEYLHLNWDLSWPWLTLGNGLATQHAWIQWYEITGVLGGTLWILAVNIMLFRLMFYAGMAERRVKALIIVACLVLPAAYSLVRYRTYTEKSDPVTVTVVQPNIDPYNEKFTTLSSRQQLVKLLQLASARVDSSTDYLVAPETALTANMWESEMPFHPDIQMLRSFTGAFPKLTVVIGASTYRQYKADEKRSSTARKFTQADGYYDSYNTALQLDNLSEEIGTYHKSKLVPGVEKMPYPKIFGFLEDLSIDLGGMSGSLGREKEAKVFPSGSRAVTGALICYESVYGEYVTDYVKKGANFLCIITNDGWWGRTPGHRQHLVYGRLRAIETRRSMARSANTGISCFYNQRGDILQPTAYWEEDVISRTLNLNGAMTFYARYGDCLAKAALIFAAAMLVLVVLKRRRRG